MILLPKRGNERAFTLVEVVLAVGIAISIFLVGIVFYNQAAQLRTELLLESDRLSTYRLLFDRITSDLRSARKHDWYGFTGGTNFIEFVKTEQVRAVWQNTNQVFTPATDLKKVRYELLIASDGTNDSALGLNRTETGLIEYKMAVAQTNTFSEETLLDTNIVAEPLTDFVKHLQFRFWDSGKWVDTWDYMVPPKAVEITMSSDAMPLEITTPEEFPFEIFRRVVFIPTGEAPPVYKEEFDLLDEL